MYGKVGQGKVMYGIIKYIVIYGRLKYCICTVSMGKVRYCKVFCQGRSPSCRNGNPKTVKDNKTV